MIYWLLISFYLGVLLVLTTQSRKVAKPYFFASLRHLREFLALYIEVGVSQLPITLRDFSFYPMHTMTKRSQIRHFTLTLTYIQN